MCKQNESMLFAPLKFDLQMKTVWSTEKKAYSLLHPIQISPTSDALRVQEHYRSFADN